MEVASVRWGSGVGDITFGNPDPFGPPHSLRPRGK
jgi:hypothetical protein